MSPGTPPPGGTAPGGAVRRQEQEQEADGRSAAVQKDGGAVGGDAGREEGDGLWEVAVDRERCIGSGICVGTAPGRFVLTGGRSGPVRAFVGPDGAVLDAAESCPMEAVTVRERGTGRLLAPEE